MDEKQIDELARMIRDYVETGSMDTRLALKFSDFVYGLVEANNKEPSPIDLLNYFLQSLRRELLEPEVVTRKPGGRAYP